MVRQAFHIELTDGARETYREEHENVPEALEEAYLDSGAGVTRYSLFEADGHVFGYLEVEDPEALDEALAESDAPGEWSERMDGLFAEVTDLEEVYRMV